MCRRGVGCPEEAGWQQRGGGRGCREEAGGQGCPQEAGCPPFSHWAAVSPLVRCFQLVADSRRPFRAWDEVMAGEVKHQAAGAEELQRKSCWCEGLFGRRPWASGEIPGTDGRVGIVPV